MKPSKGHGLWIMTLLLSLSAVVMASVPNIFQSGTVISSAQVNANFAALDTRLTAIETAIQRSGAKVVLDNATGPLPKNVAFTSNGGPLLLLVSGTGFVGAGNTLVFTVQLDAQNVGEFRTFSNESGSHKAFASKAFRVDAPAGNHTLTLLAGTGGALTSFDSNDYFNVTVVELVH